MKPAWIACSLLYVFAPSLSSAKADGIFADSHIHAFKKSTLAQKQQVPSTLTSGIFQQATDHFGRLGGDTFGQRYWVESSYAAPGTDAPVIYHICGEADVEQGYFLNDSAIEWAKILGAHIVYLEHRYYGQSLPFADLSTAHLQYLTLDNVIEDLAAFQKWLAANQGWKGKWISVGGSYSGTLSAIYRQKHPELVVGALASSAPMVSGVGQSVDDQDELSDLSSTDPAVAEGGRQWVFQSCTTFGFWEADGGSFDSNLDNPSSWLCQQLFQNSPQVNSTAFNQNYDLPFLANTSAKSPSNILFTYGSDDVWTQIGLSQQTNLNGAIAIQVIEGAGHHFDLSAPDPSDSAAVIAARNQFVTLAQKWLSPEMPITRRPAHIQQESVGASKPRPRLD